MINLIPSQEKKIISKAFYLRFVVVTFWVFTILMLLSSIILLPSFFYSNLKKGLVLDQIELQKRNPPVELEQGAETLVKDLENKLTLMQKFQNDKFLISDKIINKIQTKQNENIKITEINYVNDKTKGKTLELRGVAVTRDDLLFFKNNFDKDPDFKKIELPISNFIKSNNIQFNLILTPV